MSITILHQSNNRVYKRQNAIRDSQEKEKVEEEEKEEKCQDPQTEDDEIPPRHIVMIPSVITCINFWKRTKIYPEEAPVYPDASTYVSSRKRTGDGRRARTNECDSDSDSDSDNIIT